MFLFCVCVFYENSSENRRSKSTIFTFLQIQTLVISAKNTKNSIQIEPSATKDSIWRPTSWFGENGKIKV